MTLVPVQLNAEVIDGRDSLSRGHTLRATVLRPGRLCIVAVAIVAGLLLAACSSSTTTSPGSGATTTSPGSGTTTAAPPSPSPTSAVCQAAAELRTSVNNLAHIKIGKDTVNEIKSNLADVEAKFSALTAQLHDANQPQVGAAKSSLDTLMTAVSNLSAHPSTSTLQAVATAVTGVTTAAGNLLTSLAPQCGSTPASPTS
jgi:hypothetical protein